MDKAELFIKVETGAIASSDFTVTTGAGVQTMHLFPSMYGVNNIIVDNGKGCEGKRYRMLSDAFIDSIVSIEPVCIEKSLEHKLRANLTNAIRLLEKSGLSPEYLTKLRMLDGQSDESLRDLVRIATADRMDDFRLWFASRGISPLSNIVVLTLSDRNLFSIPFGKNYKFIKDKIKEAFNGAYTWCNKYRYSISFTGNTGIVEEMYGFRCRTYLVLDASHMMLLEAE